MGRVAGAASALMARGMDAASAQAGALGGLAAQVARQGAVLGFERTFTVGAMLFAAAFPLVWLLRAPPRQGIAAGSRPNVEIEV
jgi:hypothetical protein